MIFKKKILIVGAGGHAVSVIDVIEGKLNWKIGGLIGTEFEKDSYIHGYKVIGTDKELEKLRGKFSYAFLGIGQIKDVSKRKKIGELLKLKSFIVPSIISNNAYVSKKAVIGAGTFVGHGAVINSGVRIGENTIINSQSLVEHGVSIGNYCHISTGTILNGDVEVEDECFIGSASMVREGIKIQRGSIIPAYSRIMNRP